MKLRAKPMYSLHRDRTGNLVVTVLTEEARRIAEELGDTAALGFGKISIEGVTNGR